jgi:predicted kinase
MPTLYMMIGVPGSGKSTWIANQNFDWNKTMVVSTDAIIDQRAAAQGKTYSEVFQNEIKGATAQMNANLKNAIANNMDIALDQTNLTPKSRQSKLSQIPKNYRKVAVYFSTPDDQELMRRLANRPGKTIPTGVVANMISQLQPPTKAEGFDEIISV